MEELQIIQSKIYEIRGKKVMLDRDLADLYQVETRVLNQAVKRNIERFPNEFMFQLSDKEFINWKSQIVITNSVNMGLRHNPYAFTEQGVSMLSAVLRSPIAIQISIRIMNAFVAMREYLINTNLQSAEIKELRAKIEALEMNGEDTLKDVNDLSEDLRKEIDNIYLAIGELSVKAPITEKPRSPIGYDIDRSKK
ncbi:MAG: ORF6N domain-containing protein [Rikenellaceae bacterium]